MEAFEAFLKYYPEWQGKVVMIQVTEPVPNESPKMSTKISRYVDHINVSVELQSYSLGPGAYAKL